MSLQTCQVQIWNRQMPQTICDFVSLSPLWANISKIFLENTSGNVFSLTQLTLSYLHFNKRPISFNIAIATITLSPFRSISFCTDNNMKTPSSIWFNFFYSIPHIFISFLDMIILLVLTLTRQGSPSTVRSNAWVTFYVSCDTARKGTTIPSIFVTGALLRLANDTIICGVNYIL